MFTSEEEINNKTLMVFFFVISLQSHWMWQKFHLKIIIQRAHPSYSFMIIERRSLKLNDGQCHCEYQWTQAIHFLLPEPDYIPFASNATRSLFTSHLIPQWFTICNIVKSGCQKRNSTEMLLITFINLFLSFKTRI